VQLVPTVDGAFNKILTDSILCEVSLWYRASCKVLLVIIGKIYFAVKIFHEHYNWSACETATLGMLLFRFYVCSSWSKDVSYL